jgi:hypothetical protein
VWESDKVPRSPLNASDVDGSWQAFKGERTLLHYPTKAERDSAQWNWKA